MKKSRPYIRLYVTAIIISVSSSCGTVATTSISHCSSNGTNADTVITVKQNQLDLFMQRYIPEYGQDIKAHNDTESEYGISVREAFEHYSRIYIKERDMEVSDELQSSDNEPNKSLSCTIAMTDSCANKKPGTTDSSNLTNSISQIEKVCPTTVDSPARHILACRIIFSKGDSYIDILNSNNIKKISRCFFIRSFFY